MKETMKKIFRLKRNEDIKAVVEKRECIKNDSFSLYYIKQNSNENVRVCISTSKKIGDAVTRNKIRRQVREMINSIFDFSIKYDIVIVVKNNYLNHSFEENKINLNYSYSKLINKETNNEKN